MRHPYKLSLNHSHLEKPFQIWNETLHEIPIVVSIPHSGTFLPQTMKEMLLPTTVLPNTDWYLPELYDFLKELGFTVLINHISRYVIDPNRGTAQGIGEGYTDSMVYTKTTMGKEMYARLPTQKDAAQRMRDYYVPYHTMIHRLTTEKLKHFDNVYLLDLHSFCVGCDADMILGDLDGKSCSNAFRNEIKTQLEAQGFTTACNVLYSGGYITKTYGKPDLGCEAMQLELRYRTYIENRDFGEEIFPKVNPELFESVQQRLNAVFIALKHTFTK